MSAFETSYEQVAPSLRMPEDRSHMDKPSPSVISADGQLAMYARFNNRDAVYEYLQPDEVLVLDTKNSRATKYRLPSDSVRHSDPSDPLSVQPNYKVLDASKDFTKFLLSSGDSTNQLYLLDLTRRELTGILDAPVWDSSDSGRWSVDRGQISRDGQFVLYMTALYERPKAGTIALRMTETKHFGRNIYGEIHRRNLATKRDEVVTGLAGSGYEVGGVYVVPETLISADGSKVFYMKNLGSRDAYFSHLEVSGCELMKYENGSTKRLKTYDWVTCTSRQYLQDLIADAVKRP